MDSDNTTLIDEAYEKLSEEISNLHDFWNTIKKNTEDTLKELQNRQQRIEEINANPNIDEVLKRANGKTFSNHLFMSPYTGENVLLGHSEIDISKKVELCFILKNKHYQWVLTEAYELFEDYIESLYACAGYINNDFWPASDYGSISISDISNKDLAWFQITSKKKKEASRSILNKFRSDIENFAKVETTNALVRNYRFNITMIEFLRHIIVHNGGYFNDTNLFIDNVLKRSGINGKEKEKFEEMIRSFIGKIHNKETVLLIEAPSQKLPFFLNAHFSRIRFLLNIIIEYSFIIKEELKKHLSDK
ncbi:MULTISPECIES: hypothetical protein [Enterobacteriaceae]|uniref:hypothetical protein n=1 Tax=Enterobacteriaceae TaxID=543 RepID=UPI001F14CF08|nr:MULTISPECIES: hypothetical protein [Enterobacteriaceae]EJG2190532.1 hypothetical protein [Citrobacter freundii]MED5728815.1 hypothetical protein [Enterobacter hormaechei]